MIAFGIKTYYPPVMMDCQQEPIADPSLSDGSTSKTKRTPMLVASGPREVLRQAAEPMSDNEFRGQETPDRQTTRLVTDGGQITVCPECDSSSIKPRRPGKHSSRKDLDGDWYCSGCGIRFDEPAERERKSPGGLHGLARELSEAEPGDLVTDGGQPWQPIGAHYSPGRGRWRILFARYGESGWEYSERVEEVDATMLHSERGGVSEGDSDLLTDGGRDRPTHHGVCRDCPDEWVGGSQAVHRDAEIHSLSHGHRTEVAEVTER